MIQFEWDPQKATINQQKHDVSFSEASTVFYDTLAVIFDDEIHSDVEQREIIVGHSNQQRLLLVCFVERVPDTIRLISARPTTRKETRDYEQGQLG